MYALILTMFSEFEKYFTLSIQVIWQSGSNVEGDLGLRPRKGALPPFTPHQSSNQLRQATSMFLSNT
ncbi:MAG: hypothetical protein HC835_02615 [Oscillatoriales cyanobacterium RM2_1_1]|nr:hypothetical protein [Oscillatoriales cyanobacterium SM2_3_0]NJO44604.1 hypothetical protein [Oscillatoriales cyanobacterium RM2_1_1]